ncbi:type II CAAX endopeptidase family protein [Bacillus sp. S13(2024)]|uniref:CPBP family glutamic-type intramembrane protease n=1 Tax=unclassified Bacillus (in: firmicutes) TaxID=185979 RepID=UPI003D19F4B8
MFKKISDLGKAGMFTILVLIIASVMGLVFHVRAEVYMFSPLIAVVIMLIVTRDAFTKKGWKELGIHKAGFSKWRFAICIPLIVLTTSYILFWLTPYASIVKPEDLDGAPLWFVLIKLLVVFVLYTITSALGEEIGWRGYLLPKLQSVGTKNALWLSGFIHAIFHFPIIFAGNYLTEGNPFIIVPLFVVMTMFGGIFFGYVRITTGSVWPATIMHSVHNVYFNLILEQFTHSESNVAQYLGGESGIIVVGLYGVVCFWILKKGNIARQNTNLSQHI